jgi:hypothetical protein
MNGYVIIAGSILLSAGVSIDDKPNFGKVILTIMGFCLLVLGFIQPA